MSGGHFNYTQYNLLNIADKIAEIVKEAEYKPETLARFKEAERTILKAHAMAQRVDWLLSGDDSEDAFHQRWDEEGLGPALASFHAYDADEADLYSHALGYCLALLKLGEEMRRIDKYALEKYKDTEELIHYLREFYYATRSGYHLPED
jgi:hypothetical protein